MPINNWKPTSNLVLLNALYSKVKLVATTDENPYNMLVYFSTMEQLQRAKKSIETHYSCKLSVKDSDCNEGAYGLWIPQKISILDRETLEYHIFKTGESHFLEMRVNDNKIPYVHTETMDELNERLEKLTKKMTENYKENFGKRGLN